MPDCFLTSAPTFWSPNATLPANPLWLRLRHAMCSVNLILNLSSENFTFPLAPPHRRGNNSKGIPRWTPTSN